MAYQCGNAANIAPAASTSHVSLASQTGPIVLIMTRRPMSSLPRTGSSAPTPKSNPSSMKYDANMKPISRNQNSGNVTGRS